MTDQPDELYTLWMGSVAAVCRCCGVLLYPNDEVKAMHTAWHARQDQADGYAAEQTEREA